MCGIFLRCLAWIVIGAWGSAIAGGVEPAAAESSSVIPVASTLPVAKGGVLRIGDDNGVDRQATVAPLADGGFLMVYANLATGDLDSARLRVAVSADGTAVSRPGTLSFGGNPEDAPAFVTVGGETWLYFASAASDLRELKLWRSRVRNGFFSPAERLPGIEGLNRLNQWPRWVGAEPGVGITFRGKGAIPTWGLSSDGIRWERTTALGERGVAYPRVVPLGELGCFFSYQRPPDGGYMATYFKVSDDCNEWSDPIPITWPAEPNRPDVHDAYALPRLDGGVDVYYVYPSLKGDDAKIKVGFDLYRRAVGVDGALGAEQLLTDRMAFHPFAPSAHRLEDGRVLVMFSDIDAVGAEAVSTAAMTVFVAPGDAPAAPPRE